MKESEIRKSLGDAVWPTFSRWMVGQTVSAYPDGEMNYYEWDYKDFEEQLVRYLKRKEFTVWD
jgi:hypothetical protein